MTCRNWLGRSCHLSRDRRMEAGMPGYLVKKVREESLVESVLSRVEMAVVNGSWCGVGSRIHYHETISCTAYYKRNWICFRPNVEEKLGICVGTSRAMVGTAIFTPPLKLANALTYEEFLEQAAGSPEPPPPDFDVNGVAEAVANFWSDNPLLFLSGVALVVLPFILTPLFWKPNRWATISAIDAYSDLRSEEAQLLDIRSVQDITETGSPDLSTLRKRAVQLSYSGDDVSSFLKKVSAKFKEPANTTLYILDKFDGNSVAAAKLLVENGFEAAYSIKGGVQGNNGWKNTELPWLIPKNTFMLDLEGLKQIIDGTVEENPGIVQAILVVAAATGIGLVVFSEVESALQLLGSAALVHLFIKKLLFAEDRKRTFEELEVFLDTTIALKEIDEMKRTGKISKSIDVETDNGAAIPQDQEADANTITVENARATEKQPAKHSSMTPSGAEAGT